MADSVGFYNWGFSIMRSKIQDLLDPKIVKGYATTIPSNLVKECPINEQPIGKGLYMNLIPNWTKQERYIKILENNYKNNGK